MNNKIYKPILVDTSAVLAAELIFAAGLRCGAVQRFVLIGSINTVWIAITHPSFRDTGRPVPHLIPAAGELLFGIALPRVALMASVLVGAVQTVVVSIAEVRSRDTVAVITGEEIAETGPLL